MEFDGTDRPADMIDSLFDDTDPILFEVEQGLPFATLWLRLLVTPLLRR